MSYLITGGAGYIGAHVVRAMRQAGETVVVLDDLSTGVAARMPEGVPLVVGSTLDRELLDAHPRRARRHRCRASRGEEAGRRVGRACRCTTTARTCDGLADAAGGGGRGRGRAASCSPPRPRSTACRTWTWSPRRPPALPINPYGETKLAGEWLVRAAGRAHGIATACLRYFNVGGRGHPRAGRHRGLQHRPDGLRAAHRGRAPRGSSATTTTPRTAPASATTSMSPTWPRPMWRPPAGSPSRARSAI